MRKIKDISDIVKEVNSDFPDGTIINETDTQDGTPVIREIYGDILNNNYKIMRETGVDSNSLEDSESNGFQLVEAIKKLPNTLNDVERVISFDGTNYNVYLNFNYLPDKYVFVARVDSNYVAGSQIFGTLNKDGQSPISYSLVSPTGFNASDEVLVILDQSSVRVYSLTKTSQEEDSEDLLLSLGNPLAYNDVFPNIMKYQEDGYLIDDSPKSVYVEGDLRFFSGDGTLIVLDIVFVQNQILCYCFSDQDKKYIFYLMETDFSNIRLVTGINIDASVNDYKPYFFTDQNRIILTNQANNSDEDHVLSFYSLDWSAGTAVLTSELNLDPSFKKTTSIAVSNLIAYTLVEGVLNGYDLNTGNAENIAVFNSAIGSIFVFGQQKIYFSFGQIAKLWQL